jgi:hypothetical protein
MSRSRIECSDLVWVLVGAWVAGMSLLPAECRAAAPRIIRGPYLQLGTPTSIVVRWRTDAEVESRVQYGTNAAALDLQAEGTGFTTNHLVTITNLLPDTVYFYSVGLSNLTLAGGSNYFFRTAPLFGAQRPIRIWALGDFGFTNQFAVPVRDAYYNFTTNHYTDLWLMLGDNAYHNGGDEVWQVAIFNTYSNVLQQTPVWSTIGNQETGGSSTLSPARPYLDTFTFPTNAEAGGVASGTEKYYSFDYGNVHFICLDSMSSLRTAGSPMLTWLEADLQQTTNDWVIAFWHHPPYSKGSNDSDVRQEQIEMRSNAVPLLEAYGVDLVLCGHSHSYERSYLLDGHYGLSSTFSANFVKDGGDGRIDGDGAYQKGTLGPAGHDGAVYAVGGSGAALGGGQLNHPAMYQSLNVLGSFVLDIHANRLEAKFLRETGAIDDYFTIIKGAQPLRFTSTTVSNGLVTIRWASVADRDYHIELTPTLAPASWTNVSGNVRADAPETSWSVDLSVAEGSGFFRVSSAGN